MRVRVVAANIPADTIAAPHTKDAEQFMPWVGVQCASPELVTSWVFATVHGWVERTAWWCGAHDALWLVRTCHQPPT